MGGGIMVILYLIVGLVIGYVVRKLIVDSKIAKLEAVELKIKSAEIDIQKIKQEASKQAENIIKEGEIKAKEEVYRVKEIAEREIKDWKQEIKIKENKIDKKEENLDKKLLLVETKEEKIEQEKIKVVEQEKQIYEIIDLQKEKLKEISGLSQEEATNIFMQELEGELTSEIANKIRDHERNLEETKKKQAAKILGDTIAKAASDFVVENTISVVHLPNDEMKGRIIGREGRNIRVIEQLTGVDLIVDDTPEAVVISNFDGVRREIAKKTLEKLIADGRIHPTKIEECLKKAKKEVESLIMDAGEEALLNVGVQKVHPEIVKLLGRLKYRTSYGQNVLEHSVEMAHFAGALAAELGCDIRLAKRSALLHDVGKALTAEHEGTHALLGGEFLRRYKEDERVVNGAESHHNEVEKICVESVLVQAADALSATRPGARRETLQSYIKRLEALEKIANEFEGVEASYAIQAGREIRIIVNPEKVSDDEALIMAREIANKVEENLQYPGMIKVNLIREKRSVEYAK